MVELRIYQYSMLHRCIFRLQNQSLFPIRSRLSEGKPHEYLKKTYENEIKEKKANDNYYASMHLLVCMDHI